MTNYDYIRTLDKKQLALCLAQIEDPLDWVYRNEVWLNWLNEETELDFSNIEKYYKETGALDED